MHRQRLCPGLAGIADQETLISRAARRKLPQQRTSKRFCLSLADIADQAIPIIRVTPRTLTQRCTTTNKALASVLPALRIR
jgi:hypothetical protein